MKDKQVKLTVIGGGRMARALGRILGNGASDVHLFARSPERRRALADDLPGIRVDDDIAHAVADAHMIFFAVSAPDLDSAANDYGPYARGDHLVLTACRGVGPGFALPHEVIRGRTCVRKIGILGGPIHARELASGRQINAVVASRYSEVIDTCRAMTADAPVTIHSSQDIVGVQVAQAVANVASIAAGMADALDQSATARGLLMAHGLVDAKRLGRGLGAEERTFFGLAGVGELIPRQVTSMDRHVALGRLIAQGWLLEQALAELDGSVEGVDTAAAAVGRGREMGLSLPLVEAVNSVLLGEIGPGDALEAVLHRSLELA